MIFTWLCLASILVFRGGSDRPMMMGYGYAWLLHIDFPQPYAGMMIPIDKKRVSWDLFETTNQTRVRLKMLDSLRSNGFSHMGRRWNPEFNRQKTPEWWDPQRWAPENAIKMSYCAKTGRCLSSSAYLDLNWSKEEFTGDYGSCIPLQPRQFDFHAKFMWFYFTFTCFTIFHNFFTHHFYSSNVGFSCKPSNQPMTFCLPCTAPFWGRIREEIEKLRVTCYRSIGRECNLTYRVYIYIHTHKTGQAFNCKYRRIHTYIHCEWGLYHSVQ